MIKNPVMFVVEVGAALTTVLLVRDLVIGTGEVGESIGFEAADHACGSGPPCCSPTWRKRWPRAAARPRPTRCARRAPRPWRTASAPSGQIETVPAASLRLGDIVIVKAGEFIPSDGEIIEGVASVDESAITGESAPVIREAGGDRSAVTGGTRVLSDWIKVKVSADPGHTFLDRMIALVEGAERQKTPNEIALNILLAGLTIVFLMAVVTLQPFAVYSGAPQSVFVLVSLLVCLIPTTIGGLLSAIGIAGMDRLIQHNVLAMSGRAVEAAGDVHTLLLDKTGTITLGNRQATEFIPVAGTTEAALADAAQLASLADETPEGRSIVVLAKQKYNIRGRDLAAHQAAFVPFTAQTRMSGVNLDGREIRKGAADAIKKYVGPGTASPEIDVIVERIARAGGTPLVVAERQRAIGVIHLKDVIKGGMRERFARLARHGHQDRDDHRRQPAHRRGDRQRSGRRRLPRRGDAGRQDDADQAGAARRQAGGDDRRRHQRRAGAGAGRCRRGHEHRHAGGQGSRQHGRPRFEPDQADRDRRDRQAAADDPRHADDVLDCQ